MARALRRVLLTNDDGFDAPGLRTLEEVAYEIADEVWVVAPDHDQSGTSHSLSLHAPLRVAKKDERKFSVSGTPADCVVMAARHLMPEVPDLVLSGINRGANLGLETVFSGTVGAAMTGMLLGIPSMALSQAFSDRDDVPWQVARALASDVILEFAAGSWSEEACLNINFPNVSLDAVGCAEVTTQGKGYLDDVAVIQGVDPRSIDYHWLSLQRSDAADEEGTEAHALRAGRISVTPLQFERTNMAIFKRLERARVGPASSA